MTTQGFPSLILPLHIVAGVLALLFGYTALAAAKGATLHRKSGRFFVFAMVAMSLTGALIATLRSSSISVIAGLLTFYFVTTALLTVRPRTKQSPRIDGAAMRFAFAVATLGFIVGIGLAGRGSPEAAPMFIFGLVGVLAANGDRRMIRAGGIQGPKRIARHLWRMCFGMWVAAASFFLGPRGRVPEAIDIPTLKAVAVMAPIAMMVYWLWRLRSQRAARALPVRSPEPA